MAANGICVYIAGTRHDARIADGTVARAIRAAGSTIVSKWHDLAPGDVDGTPESRQRTAMANFRDLCAADMVVAVPCATHHLRGAHVEIGYALGRGVPVVILGQSGDFNTMTEHARIRYARDLEALAKVLNG